MSFLSFFFFFFSPANLSTKKRRVLGVHHLGEKYRAVAARLKKDEKKGFSVQDFLDGKQEPTSPRTEGPADLNPQPETKVDESSPAAAPAMDVD